MQTRKKLKLPVVAALALILVGLWFLITWVDYPLAAMGLDRATERALKAGVPIDPEDFPDGAPADPAQNAAPEYMRLGDQYAALWEEARNAMREVRDDPRRRPQEALRIAAAYAEPARALEAASRLPYFYPGRDLSLGVELTFPDLARLIRLHEFIVERGIAHARVGSPEAAARDLVTGRRIARHVAQEAIAIPFIMAIRNESSALQATSAAASALADDPSGLAILETQVLGMGELPVDSLQVMRGEAHLILRHFPPVSEPVRGGLRTPGGNLVSLGFRARMLDAWTAYFEALPESGGGHEDHRRAHAQAYASAQRRGLSHRAAREIFRGESLMYQVLLRVQANHAVVAAHLDVLQHRNRTGRWPETLAEAGVDTPDPATGEPLLYRVEGDGFRVWSVGENQMDDGGVHPLERGEQDAGDDIVAAHPFPVRVRR